MKTISKLFAILFGMAVIASNTAMAESAQFTPLNFNDSTAIRTSSTSSSSTASQAIPTDKNALLDPSQVTGGSKMQNAILQLDNAQIEVRNQLLQSKTTYTEVDSRLKATKAERKAAKRKMKQAEKRIKNIEKAKVKIRKNFEQKINL